MVIFNPHVFIILRLEQFCNW